MNLLHFLRSSVFTFSVTLSLFLSPLFPSPPSPPFSLGLRDFAKVASFNQLRLIFNNRRTYNFVIVSAKVSCYFLTQLNTITLFYQLFILFLFSTCFTLLLLFSFCLANYNTFIWFFLHNFAYAIMFCFLNFFSLHQSKAVITTLMLLPHFLVARSFQQFLFYVYYCVCVCCNIYYIYTEKEESKFQ